MSKIWAKPKRSSCKLFTNNFIDLKIQLIFLSLWVNLPEFFSVVSLFLFLYILPKFRSNFARILPPPPFAKILPFCWGGGHRSPPPPHPGLLRLWWTYTEKRVSWLNNCSYCFSQNFHIAYHWIAFICIFSVQEELTFQNFILGSA